VVAVRWVSFGTAVPFWSSVLADARHLPHGRSPGGDRHLNFYGDRDNLERYALAEGVAIFQASNSPPPTAAIGLPGSLSVAALVMVPLVEDSSRLGMLLVGRRSANGHDVAG
jgi:hypothetical protein